MCVTFDCMFGSSIFVLSARRLAYVILYYMCFLEFSIFISVYSLQQAFSVSSLATYGFFEVPLR